MNSALLNILAETPVISAVRDKFFGDALSSPSRVIFLLGGSILNLSERVRATAVRQVCAPTFFPRYKNCG